MNKHLVLLLFFTLLMYDSLLFAQQPKEIKHVIAAIEKDKFHGWPANNGAWHWGDEILVGFTQGDFQVKGGHNIAGIQQSKFARSLDGGETWQVFDPENFLDDENIKWLPKGKKYLEKPINFQHAGLAMRIFATGYHGNDDPEGGFYYSYDRGKTWNGPYFLGKINNHKELKGKILNPRTDYIVMGERECFIFIAARDTTSGSTSRIGCIKTNDGGMSFDFVTWVTPATGKSNAIMSSTIQLSENKFILTHRDIKVPRKPIESTINAYISEDRCQSWRFLSTVKVIYHNSNPPALVKLTDGRLCCIYGDRDNLRVSGKYSNDEGKTWGEEFVIRDNFKSLSDWGDFGYPRLMQRTDGNLVAMYYWASPENIQQHIAVSIWKP